LVIEHHPLSERAFGGRRDFFFALGEDFKKLVIMSGKKQFNVYA
jgi:hypothetical protein